MPGPAPKPTALKKRMGNPGKRPLNTREAKAKGRPAMGAHMSTEAKRFWKIIVPDLVRAGLATTIDREALARYCELVVQERVLRQFINENGWSYPVKSEAGPGRPSRIISIKPWPQATIYRDYQRMLLAYEVQFGMTASSRSRIQLDQVPETPNPRMLAGAALLDGTSGPFKISGNAG